jgi:hypothetical protein
MRSSTRMASRQPGWHQKLHRTEIPGIFKRGNRYVFSYRVNGKQRWESCASMAEAFERKSKLVTERNQEARAAHREIIRANSVRLAENRRTAAEALSLMIRAAQALQRVADTSEGDLVISARACLMRLYENEDSLKRAMYRNT